MAIITVANESQLFSVCGYNGGNTVLQGAVVHTHRYALVCQSCGLLASLANCLSLCPSQVQVRTEEPVAAALSESIPKFHFPRGRPQANLNIDGLISKIEKIFSQFPNERATIEEMGQVAKVRI